MVARLGKVTSIRQFAMMMNKYWAVYKQKGDARGRTISITAPDIGAAIDDMMKQLGKARTEDEDEYDLYAVRDNQAYVLVASKLKRMQRSQPPLTIEKYVVEQHTFTEKLYVSWRDAA